MAYHAVFLPQNLLTQLPLREFPRLRVDAEIRKCWLNAALQSAKRGKYLLLSADFLKEAGLALGDVAEVRFNIADQTAVEVPRELEDAVLRHPHTRQIWESLTPGRRRSHAYRVTKAVRPENREQRVLEVLEDMHDEWNRRTQKP